MTTATTATVLAHAPLTKADRCDRCSAAAQVRAVLVSGELLFCGHHARVHRARLLDLGASLRPDP